MTRPTRIEDPRLEHRLQSAGQKVTAALQARDALIRDAAAAGMTNRQIAEAVGLSHVAVAKVLARG